jgi:hypothetical protein
MTMSTAGTDFTQGDEPERRAGLSRRTVVRAGAQTALAVPLITIATSAPALAVSGPSNPGSTAPVLTISEHGVIRLRSEHKFLTRIQLTNVGTAATTAPIIATLTMPKGTRQFKRRPKVGHHIGAGWRGPILGGGKKGPWTWTFIYEPKVATGQVTTLLQFVLKVAKHRSDPARRFLYGRSSVTFSASTKGAVAPPSLTSEISPDKTYTRVVAK